VNEEYSIQTSRSVTSTSPATRWNKSAPARRSSAMNGNWYFSTGQPSARIWAMSPAYATAARRGLSRRTSRGASKAGTPHGF
jgi:hypothetical protein